MMVRVVVSSGHNSGGGGDGGGGRVGHEMGEGDSPTQVARLQADLLCFPVLRLW